MGTRELLLILGTLSRVCYSQIMEGVQTGFFIDNAGGTNHPCYRTCVHGKHRTCNYNFTVSEYATMNGACGDCPFNITDCFANGCITAGGHKRAVQVVNTRLPGTSIEVCLGDTIIIDLQNMMPIEATTIHWHGIHQRYSPEMDGVPFVTQCPILPNNRFQYKFIADTAGTHMYHAHMGHEDAEGLFGALIVRRPLEDEPNAYTYDYDLPQHTVVIWHWFEMSARETFTLGRFLNQRVNGTGMIINGKGRIKIFPKDNKYYATPVEVFRVLQGRKYRFRVIYNAPIFCHIQISIDDHPMTVINTDSGNIKPIEVDSIMINAGERYDFVLNANKNVGNYWLRVRGDGDCFINKVHQEAVIHYEGAARRDPRGIPSYESSIASGRLLNPIPMKGSSSKNTLIQLTDLVNVEYKRAKRGVSGKPDHTYYISLRLNRYGTLELPGPYPQLNNNTYRASPIPLLTQRDELTDDMYCTENTKSQFCNEEDFCSCPYILETELNSLVELIIVDPRAGGTSDHPFHLHGFEFHVVAIENLPEGNKTFDYVKLMNEQGQIKKKLFGAPLKDTVSVPVSGFTVIRFHAANPGYWLFHCHIGHHMEMGMAMVLKVGKHNQMAPIPKNFPKCGHYTKSPSSSTSLLQPNLSDR